MIQAARRLRQFLKKLITRSEKNCRVKLTAKDIEAQLQRAGDAANEGHPQTQVLRRYLEDPKTFLETPANGDVKLFKQHIESCSTCAATIKRYRDHEDIFRLYKDPCD